MVTGESPPTRLERIYDIVLGIALPLLCIWLDPLVFQGRPPGNKPSEAMLGRFQPFAYAWMALEMLVLLLWIVPWTRRPSWGGLVGGFLLLGAAGSFCLGVLLALPSFFGICFYGLGLLGFTPFLTSIAYLRNVRLALRVRRESLGGGAAADRAILEAAVGALAALPFPLWAQSELTPVSFAALLRSGLRIESDVVAFSTDSRAVLWGREGLRLQDARSGAVLRRLAVGGPEITSLAVAADGRHAAAGDASGRIRIWNAATWEQEAELTAHAGRVGALEFFPDGRLLASGGADALLQIWEVASGRLSAALPGHHHEVSAIAIALAGDLLYSGARDGTIRVWERGGWRLVRELGPGRWGVTALAVSPDGRLLASGSGGVRLEDDWAAGETILWDVAAGYREDRPKLPNRGYYVTSLRFSPDGTRLACTTLLENKKWWDSSIGILWDLSGREPTYLELRSHVVGRLAYSPDGKSIAAGGWSSALLLEAATGRFLMDLEARRDAGVVAFSADGRLVASGDDAGSLHIWETDSARHLRTLAAGTIRTLAFDPAGSRVVAGCDDGAVRAFDVGTGERGPTFESGPQLRIWSLGFSPNGGLLAALSGMALFVWDGRTGALLAEDRTSVGGATRLAFVDEGRILLVGSEICLWDFETRALLRRFRRLGQRTEVAWAAMLSGRRALAVSLSYPARLEIWDHERGILLRTFDGSETDSGPLSLSQDGRSLAGFCRDLIAIWDAEGEAPARFVSVPREFWQPAAFSPGGEYLCVCGDRRSGPDAFAILTLIDVRTGSVLRTFEAPAGP